MTDDDARIDELQADLAATLPRVAPPPDLFDRVLVAVGESPRVVPLESARARRRLTASAAGVAAAVAAVAALALVLTDRGAPALDYRAAISGEDSGIHGEAEVFDAGVPGGKVVVRLEDVSPPPSGHHYEVWVLREGVEEMEAVGSFTPDSSTVVLELPLPGPGSYAAVDVSVEEDGGSPAHSGTSIAGGTLARV